MSKVFAEGLIAKKGYWNKAEEPHVKLSVKVDEFIKFLKDNEEKGWVNIEVKTSKKGNVFATLDEWKPGETKDDKPKPETEVSVSETNLDDIDDELPF